MLVIDNGSLDILHHMVITRMVSETKNSNSKLSRYFQLNRNQKLKAKTKNKKRSEVWGI